MTADNPTAEHADDWLITCHAGLVAELAVALDMTAGIAEATQPRHYIALATDLNVLLNLSSGLASIVDPQTMPDTTETRTVKQPHYDSPHARSRTTTQLAALLESLDAPKRLILRAHPTHAAFRESLDLLTEVEDALAATDSIDVADDCARNHAVTLAARLSNDLTRDRTRDFYLTHDIDGSYRARVLARDRAHALVDALTPDRTGDPSAAVVLARRCAHALTQALTEARDRAHDRARGRADNLSRAFAHTRLDTATADITALRDLLNIVDTVTTDFIGADLRAASLKGIDLQRVRWSNTTKWPSGWEQRVRVQSREIAAGVFEVVGDGHEHIPVNWVTTP